jgi:hypothetical protein
VYRRVAGSSEWRELMSLSVGEDAALQYLDEDVEPGIAYEYEVEVLGPSGPEGPWGPVSVELPEVALWLGLSPSPGPSTLTVEFGLPQAGRAVFRLYDISGREVARKELPDLRAGNHKIPWNPGDGHDLTSGVYWIRLDTPQGHCTVQCTVIR